MVCGIDDLDAEVQRLKKKLPGDPRASNLVSQDAGRPTKWFDIAAGRPHALGVAGRQVAEAWVDEVIVYEREEGLEESLHQVINVELRPHEEEANIGKELLHRAGGLVSHAAVRLLEEDVGVILRLPHQDFKSICRMEGEGYITMQCHLHAHRKASLDIWRRRNVDRAPCKQRKWLDDISVEAAVMSHEQS